MQKTMQSDEGVKKGEGDAINSDGDDEQQQQQQQQ